MNFHSTANLPPKACGPCTSKSARANPARLYSWSFTPLAVFFFSFQLIPPDENLVGHFKASARGLTAMDLTVPDALLVLWSLNPSLKGLLQPIYSNPLFRVQLDQKGTQCNPNDRGRLMNTGTLSWCIASWGSSAIFGQFGEITLCLNSQIPRTAASASTGCLHETHFCD